MNAQTKSFTPGGRRFTLITPLPNSGRPANVLMPVLAPDASFSNISHLVKKPHTARARNQLEEHQHVEAYHGRARSAGGDMVEGEKEGIVKRETVAAMDEESLMTMPSSSVVGMDDVGTGTERESSIGPIRREHRRRSSRFFGSSTASGSSVPIKKKKTASANSPYADFRSKKLYRSERVFWYRWAGTAVLDAPPPVPVGWPPIPDRALFVYNYTGGEGPQIWQRDITGTEPSWKPVMVGAKQEFKGTKYVLTLTSIGDPSWLATSTVEKNAQRARRVRKELQRSFSDSSGEIPN